MISVIVPIYNDEECLSQCIESLINQNYKDLEIILVDDGSADNSVNICDGYAAIDERIKVLRKSNGGVSSARNLGMDNAMGEYVQFVDADDYVDENICELLVKAIESGDYELAICGYKRVYKDKTVSVRCKDKSFGKIYDLESDFSRFYKDVIINSPWNKLYKKIKIRKHFVENISLGEDLIFNLEYMDSIDSIICIEEDLYNYRIGINNLLTRKYRTDAFETALLLYENINGFVVKYFSENFDKRDLNTISFIDIFMAMRQMVYFSDLPKIKKYEKLKEWSNEPLVEMLSDNMNTRNVQLIILKYLIKFKLHKGTYSFFKLKYHLRNIFLRLYRR